MAGRPVHTSHTLQALDFGVFASCEEHFKRLLSQRSITKTTDTRNEIFIGCELLKQIYHHSITAENIMGDFTGTGSGAPVLEGHTQSR